MPHPLDYAQQDYAYIERPNPALLGLFDEYAPRQPGLRVLDVGAGAGANARALRGARAGLHWTALEPNARAAELARAACDEVFEGELMAYLAGAETRAFDVVVLSDVLEHLADPVQLLTTLHTDPRTRRALFLVSVPNYGVWYNRLRTLAGRFEYAHSGLYDRTHLRFFTRASIRRLFDYVGFDTRAQRCTPSLVQSLAPYLRRGFERDVAAGDHLSLERSRAYALYQRWVEPGEARLCALWPELLGFQIVSALSAR